MHRHWRARATSVALMVLALATGCGGSSAGDTATSNGSTYKIAIVADLTGPQAPTATAASAGAQAYLRKIKAAGGVNGHPVEWTVGDSQTNPQAAVAAFQSVIAAQDLAVIHAGASTEFPAIQSLVNQAGIPYLSYSVPDSALYPQPSGAYYQFSPSATQQGLATAAEVKARLGGSLSGKKVAFVGLTSPYIDGLLTTVKDELSKGGATIVDTERFGIPLASFTSQAAKIAAAKPDAVISAGTVSDAVTTSKAIFTAGFSGPIVYYSAGSDTSVLQAIGSNSYIALRAATVPVAGTDIYKQAQDQGFATQAQGSAYFSIGWAAAAVAVEALRKCGNDCTAAKLAKSMETVNNFTVPNGAFFGPVNLSSSRHTAISGGQFYTWDTAAGSETKVGQPVAL